MIEYLLPIALTLMMVGLLLTFVGLSQFGGSNFFAYMMMAGMLVMVSGVVVLGIRFLVIPAIKWIWGVP